VLEDFADRTASGDRTGTSRAGHAVAEYLGQLGNPIAQRHIAILYLLADVPIERVYELVTDPDRAADGDP